MVRFLHFWKYPWKFDARHVTLGAIAATTIAAGILVWLFVSPPPELQAQDVVGPTVSKVTPPGEKIFWTQGAPKSSQQAPRLGAVASPVGDGH